VIGVAGWIVQLWQVVWWHKGLVDRAFAIVVTFTPWLSQRLGPFIGSAVMGSAVIENRVIGGVVSHVLDLDSAIRLLMSV